VIRLLLLCPLLAIGAGKPFELVDGDRVIFVGNTFFERDLHYNHLETALTARWPGRNVIFRNLGWDGDTVWGEARAEFGSPADGFASLSKHVADLKPTVIFVAYGMNESYAGPQGVDPFSQQLDRMLDMLSRTQARIILLSPIRHEDLGRPLPDPAEHNRNLRLYVDAIARIAARRSYDFVNLFDLAGSKDQPLTENGIHLNDRGYRAATWAIERALGLPSLDRVLDVTAKSSTEPTLPLGTTLLKAPGLPPGRHALRIDGKITDVHTAEEWSKGVRVGKAPGADQLEKLRALIAEKNLHYFHYWRPQNDTYIFGFRRKEQGNLTAEFPKYPPILDEKDAEIAKLRVPVEHTYVLEPSR
jgi:lysophospholipase L1-like esterase